MKREHLRKAVHAGLGVGAFLPAILAVKWIILACAVAVLFNWLLLPRVCPWLLRAEGSGGHRGLVLYPAILGLLFLVFRDQPVFAQLGWISLAIGDAVAGLVGPLMPRPSWPWNRRKRLLGSAAGQLCAGAVMLLLAPWPLALGAAVGGTLGDGSPDAVDDNISTPVLAALAAFAVQMGGGPDALA